MVIGEELASDHDSFKHISFIIQTKYIVQLMDLRLLCPTASCSMRLAAIYIYQKPFGIYYSSLAQMYVRALSLCTINLYLIESL